MFVKRKKGQSLAEYGLILALIAIVCIGALTTMGSNLNTQLGKIGAALNPSSGTTTTTGGGTTGGSPTP